MAQTNNPSPDNSNVVLHPINPLTKVVLKLSEIKFRPMLWPSSGDLRKRVTLQSQPLDYDSLVDSEKVISDYLPQRQHTVLMTYTLVSEDPHDLNRSA